jgi:hypothetical protein
MDRQEVPTLEEWENKFRSIASPLLRCNKKVPSLQLLPWKLMRTFWPGPMLSKRPNTKRKGEIFKSLAAIGASPYNKTIADVGSGISFEIFHHPRQHCESPCFVAHRRIMSGWSISAQHVISCEYP